MVDDWDPERQQSEKVTSRTRAIRDDLEHNREPGSLKRSSDLRRGHRRARGRIIARQCGRACARSLLRKRSANAKGLNQRGAYEGRVFDQGARGLLTLLGAALGDRLGP